MNYSYTGRNQAVKYNRYGRPAYMGADPLADLEKRFKDPQFLITSGLVAAGTIALMVMITRRKRRKS